MASTVDLDVEELRSRFLQDPALLEQQLLSSSELRQALLGSLETDQERSELLRCQMSNHLRHELINELYILIRKSAGDSTRVMNPLTMLNYYVYEAPKSTGSTSQGYTTPPPEVRDDSDILTIVGPTISPSSGSDRQDIPLPSSYLINMFKSCLRFNVRGKNQEGELSEQGRSDDNVDGGISANPQPTVSEPQLQVTSPTPGPQLDVEQELSTNANEDSHQTNLASPNGDRDASKMPETQDFDTGHDSSQARPVSGDLTDVETETLEVDRNPMPPYQHTPEIDDVPESTTPSCAAAVEVTNSDWMYNIWTDSSGKKLATHGALIPEGYKRYDDPQTRWICPIRSCRSLFITIRALGRHFRSAHRALQLNDNEDGTLSIVGESRMTRGIKVPPSVVSKKPLDPKEPPMAEPNLPPGHDRALKTVGHYSIPSRANKAQDVVASRLRKRSRLELSRDTTQADTTQADTTQAEITQTDTTQAEITQAEITQTETGMGLWKYVNSKLDFTPLYPIPQDGHILELLKHLTRARNLQFKTHGKRFNDLEPAHIAAMIIQVGGEKAAHTCTTCKQHRVTFRGCFVVPTCAPSSLRQSIPGCANCQYLGRTCDYGRRPLDTRSEPEDSQHLREEVTSTINESSTQVTRRQPERRPTENARKRPRPAAEPTSDGDSDDLPLAPPRTRIRQEPIVIPSSDDDSDTKPSPSSLERRAPSGANAPAGTVSNTLNPTQMSEREQWETEIGRVRGGNGSDANYDFAFSNSYLGHSLGDPIGRNKLFQIITVKPGTTHTWKASAVMERTCSIASGKLHFKMHGKEFPVSQDRAATIEMDTECTATNRLYVDAKVHVSIVLRE